MNTLLVGKKVALLNGMAKETSDTGETHLLRITDELLEPRYLSRLIYVPIVAGGIYSEDRDLIMFIEKEEDGVFIYPPDHMGEVVLVLVLVDQGNISLKRQASESARIVEELSRDFALSTQQISQLQYEKQLLGNWLDNNPFDPKIHGNSCVGTLYAYT